MMLGRGRGALGNKGDLSGPELTSFLGSVSVALVQGLPPVASGQDSASNGGLCPPFAEAPGPWRALAGTPAPRVTQPHTSTPSTPASYPTEQPDRPHRPRCPGGGWDSGSV